MTDREVELKIKYVIECVLHENDLLLGEDNGIVLFEDEASGRTGKIFIQLD